MAGTLFGVYRNEDRRSRSSSASMEKLSTQVEEAVQAASYSNKTVSRCSSTNHGHDHGDGRNQQQPAQTTPWTTPQDFVYPFEMQNRGWRGKVPPIDPFSGENPKVTIYEWLPSLQRAADWNEWTEQKIFIQLVGHLRGRALREWNLLD